LIGWFYFNEVVLAYPGKENTVTTLERSVVIKATPETIDAVATDPNRLPEWYAGVQEAKSDGKYPQVGGAVETVYKAVGINFKIKMTSMEYVQGQSMRINMEGMIAGTTRWAYQPEDDGTRLTATFEYELPGGGLGQAVNKLMVEKMNAENLEKSLENLKALVEK
jgi:carbon monoxide dehydrogenase subunit G